MEVVPRRGFDTLISTLKGWCPNLARRQGRAQKPTGTHTAGLTKVEPVLSALTGQYVRPTTPALV